MVPDTCHAYELLLAGDVGRARQLIHERWNADDRSDEVWRLRVLVEYQNLLHALDLADEAFNETGGRVRAYAELDLLCGDSLATSRLIFRRWLAIAPEGTSARARFIELELVDPILPTEQTVEMAQRLVEENDADPTHHLILGQALLANGEHRLAGTHLAQSIEGGINPERARGPVRDVVRATLPQFPLISANPTLVQQALGASAVLAASLFFIQSGHERLGTVCLSLIIVYHALRLLVKNMADAALIGHPVMSKVVDVSATVSIFILSLFCLKFILFATVSPNPAPILLLGSLFMLAVMWVISERATAGLEVPRWVSIVTIVVGCVYLAIHMSSLLA